jgi:hypothetical protein
MGAAVAKPSTNEIVTDAYVRRTADDDGVDEFCWGSDLG